MKKLVLHYGFQPDHKREYQGENIQKVMEVRTQSIRRIRVENGAWINDLGDEKYQTDWTKEERWARVEEQTINDKTGELEKSETLGFMIWYVDRSKGWL